jgi:hypothetical protein
MLLEGEAFNATPNLTISATGIISPRVLLVLVESLGIPESAVI